MYKILHKKQLSEDVFLLRIQVPLIAEERKPGQFVIVSVDDEYGERIPLTIANADEKEGSITLIFQRVGESTIKLAEKNVGDQLSTVVGPLGTPTEIDKVGTVVCVGGGIGVAPVHPIAEGYKKAGNKVISIIGARTKELVILEDEMRALSDDLIICTDDGSYGRKSLVTEPLKELCESGTIDEVVAIGPAIMMKFCAATTRPFHVKTLVSLNTIMVDGTGMCGGCRVTVGGETKFVCVDGPEFDGHQVDFDELMTRQGAYKKREHQRKEAYQHFCRLDQKIQENGEKSS